MPTKLEFIPKKFFNGRILHISTTNDPNVLFYDVVMRQNNKDLIKFPITKVSESITVFVFNENEKINSEYLIHSNKPVVCRADFKSPMEIYIYKVVDVNENVVGYIRRIGELSKVQDDPILVFSLTENKSYLDNSVKANYIEGRETFEPITSVKVSLDQRSSPSWFTQREFYGTCHTSSSNEVQRFDLQDIIKNYAKNAKSYKTTIDMITEFGNLIRQDIVYKGDTSFSSPFKSSDYGDAMIESSKFGDCEDFAHFFMRMIRLMMWTYGVVLKEKTPLFAIWEDFAANYVPLVYICKVFINGHSEYHSTLLIVPVDASHSVISFEVTNPSKSICLDKENNIKEFYQWHKEHYFLVDNFFIYRIGGTPIEGLTIEGIANDCCNY